MLNLFAKVIMIYAQMVVVEMVIVLMVLVNVKLVLLELTVQFEVDVLINVQEEVHVTLIKLVHVIEDS